MHRVGLTRCTASIYVSDERVDPSLTNDIVMLDRTTGEIRDAKPPWRKVGVKQADAAVCVKFDRGRMLLVIVAKLDEGAFNKLVNAPLSIAIIEQHSSTGKGYTKGYFNASARIVAGETWSEGRFAGAWEITLDLDRNEGVHLKENEG